MEAQCGVGAPIVAMLMPFFACSLISLCGLTFVNEDNSKTLLNTWRVVRFVILFALMVAAAYFIPTCDGSARTLWIAVVVVACLCCWWGLLFERDVYQK